MESILIPLYWGSSQSGIPNFVQYMHSFLRLLPSYVRLGVCVVSIQFENTFLSATCATVTEKFRNSTTPV